MRRFTCKPSVKHQRRSVKAATTADMLYAFEDKLSEFGVASKTDVSCSDDIEFDRSVEIFDEDYDKEYKDVGGGFGEPDKTYTLREIKEFWNKENTNDPVLKDYPSYDPWWTDTRNNFLEEV